VRQIIPEHDDEPSAALRSTEAPFASNPALAEREFLLAG
jgi:hypothetical protein